MLKRKKEKVLWVDVMNTKFSLSLQMSIIVSVLPSILKFSFSQIRDLPQKKTLFTSWIISIFSSMYPNYDRRKLIEWKCLMRMKRDRIKIGSSLKWFFSCFCKWQDENSSPTHRHTKLLMGVHKFCNLMSFLLSRMKSFSLWTWCFG